MRVLFVAMAFSAVPFLGMADSGAWFMRCLATWEPGPRSSVLPADSVDPSFCAYSAMQNCRFDAAPVACLSDLDIGFEGVLSDSRDRLPETAEGRSLGDRMFQRRTLEYFQKIDAADELNPYVPDSIIHVFAWMGNDRRDHFLRQYMLITGLLPLVERLERGKVE